MILPTFYIAGGVFSVLAERPTAEGNNVNEILGYLWTMNDLGTYSYDASADADWGVTPATSTTSPIATRLTSCWARPWSPSTSSPSPALTATLHLALRQRQQAPHPDGQ